MRLCYTSSCTLKCCIGSERIICAMFCRFSLLVVWKFLERPCKLHCNAGFFILLHFTTCTTMASSLQSRTTQNLQTLLLLNISALVFRPRAEILSNTGNKVWQFLSTAWLQWRGRMVQWWRVGVWSLKVWSKNPKCRIWTNLVVLCTTEDCCDDYNSKAEISPPYLRPFSAKSTGHLRRLQCRYTCCVLQNGVWTLNFSILPPLLSQAAVVGMETWQDMGECAFVLRTFSVVLCLHSEKVSLKMAWRWMSCLVMSCLGKPASPCTVVLRDVSWLLPTVSSCFGECRGKPVRLECSYFIWKDATFLSPFFNSYSHVLISNAYVEFQP